MDAGGMDGVVRRLFVPDMDAGGMDAATDSAAAPAPADPTESAALVAALDDAPLSIREQIARLANDPSTLEQLASLRATDPQVDSLFKAFMQHVLSCSQAPRSPEEVSESSRSSSWVWTAPTLKPNTRTGPWAQPLMEASRR